MLDFNGAGEQRAGGLIPDGTYCLLKAHIQPGAFTLPNSDPADDGLFTASRSSDAVMLSFEFTVLTGPYRGRKFWPYMTIAGGKTDDKGVSMAWNISKTTIKAMLESALGIDPKDESEQAKAARVLNAFNDLDGIEFAARIGIEPGGEYKDKNKIDYVVVPGDAEYETVRAGGEVPPKPTSRPSSGSAAARPQQSTFSWQTAAKPAAVPQQSPSAAPASGPNWLKSR